MRISINELRIGLFVKLRRRKKPLQVYGIQYMDFHDLDSLPKERRVDSVIRLHDENWIFRTDRIKDIKAIPLTEEWLIQLPCDLKLIDIPEWIKYVHQLQNWYYLENQCTKELTFKTK